MGSTNTLYVCLGILIIIIILVVVKSLMTYKQVGILSPVVFIGLYFGYYVIIPSFQFEDTHSYYTLTDKSTATLSVIGALVNYICIIIGYQLINKPFRPLFNLSKSLRTQNIKYYIATFVIIAIIIQIFTTGFSFAVSQDLSNADFEFDEDGSYGHSSAYLTLLNCLFIPACALALALKKNRKVIFISLLLITINYYVLLAFRYRLVILFATLLVFSCLYPKIRRINLKIWGPALVLLYIGTNIIGMTRSYGNGVDYSIMKELSTEEIAETSGESLSVYNHSALVMEYYSDNNEYIYFEPILTAITMPIPRAIFPDKPKGLYLRDICFKLYGSVAGGNAFLNYVEAYMSFGWIGIIINGLLIGILCKIFWLNFINHEKNIGCILMLGLFNGWCYVLISRGFMAAAFMNFIYFLIIPFLIAKLMNKFKPSFGV